MKFNLFIIFHLILTLNFTLNAQFEGKRNLILDSATCYDHGFLKEWSLILKQYWRYNSDFQPTIDSFQWYNSVGGISSIDYTLYNYDPNNFLIEERDVGKDENSNINYITAVECQYKNNFLATKLYYKIDIFNSDSTYLGKRELFYNNGYVDSVYIFGKRNQLLEKWLLKFKDSLISKIEYYSLDSLNLLWRIYRIEENLYDKKNKLIEESFTDFLDSAYAIFSKNVFLFDSSGNYLRFDYFYFDTSSQTWIKTFYCDLFKDNLTNTKNSNIDQIYLSSQGKNIIWKGSNNHQSGILNYYTLDGKFLHTNTLIINQPCEWPIELPSGLYIVNLVTKEYSYSKLLFKNY